MEESCGSGEYDVFRRVDKYSRGVFLEDSVRFRSIRSRYKIIADRMPIRVVCADSTRSPWAVDQSDGGVDYTPGLRVLGEFDLHQLSVV